MALIVLRHVQVFLETLREADDLECAIEMQRGMQNSANFASSPLVNAQD